MLNVGGVGLRGKRMRVKKEGKNKIRGKKRKGKKTILFADYLISSISYQMGCHLVNFL